MLLCYNKINFMSTINPSIFKAYDIRGIYPDEINEEAAYKIGQAFVKFLESAGEIGNRQIIVGRDARISSDNLFEALTNGIASQSADVINIGLVSTPQFYWAIIKEGAAGGVMITASHNPAQYNGFKFYASQVRPIDIRTGLLKIRDLAIANEMVASVSPGKVNSKNLSAEYLDYIKQKTNLEKIKPFRIIIDCGNGMIGPEVRELFKALPCQTEVLFADPDGRFPNHEANPSKEETLKTLQEKVLSGRADLGIAFDGDGDR
ncbi:MAG: phosphomannomutase, partial [Parcubacteria group bacterium LiPW_39]